MWGISPWLRSWNIYRHALDEGWVHGAARYDMENYPIYGKFNKWLNERRRAEDEYNNTGRDDYYSDHYQSGALDSALGSLSAPLPGVKIPTMARSLAKMYGADVQLNVARERTRGYRASERAANAWAEAWKYKK